MININMRCIEMTVREIILDLCNVININMRCIEMSEFIDNRQLEVS